MDINKTVKIGNELTDVTSFTLVLKVASTMAVVPTVATHPSVGFYVFTFTPPGDGLTYLAAFTVVHDGKTIDWTDTIVTPAATVTLSASGAYHTSDDVINEWGENNLVLWLDLDGDRSVTKINNRLQKFINRTESYVNSRFLYSRYALPFQIPIPLEIVEICALLTGAFCYRPRSSEDFDPAKGEGPEKSLVITRKKTADKKIADILLERLPLNALDTYATSTAPSVVPADDNLFMRPILPGDPQSASTLTDQDPRTYPNYGQTVEYSG